MESLGTSLAEEDIINATAATEAVISSLLFVYDSDTYVSKDDLVAIMCQTSEIGQAQANALIATLFDKESALLRHPRTAGAANEDTSRIEFNVQGLWLINDAFTHDAMSYDEIDNMILAQELLDRSGFFKRYQAKQNNSQTVEATMSETRLNKYNQYQLDYKRPWNMPLDVWWDTREGASRRRGQWVLHNYPDVSLEEIRRRLVLQQSDVDALAPIRGPKK
jgi:hypothetical protein